MNPPSPAPSLPVLTALLLLLAAGSTPAARAQTQAADTRTAATDGLTAWVLAEAARQVVRWSQAGLPA